MQGSGTAPAMSALGVAMEGYCPVCLMVDRQWVPGSTQHQAVFDGKVYRFPKAEALAAFQADPAKFAPVLGGDDIVTYARTGQRVPGKLIYGARNLDRHYFFTSEANKQAFSVNPVQYANTDLALGGACAVCRVDMKANMPGRPEVSATHNGLRYLFMGPQQKQAFLATPARYAAPAAAPSGSGSTGIRSGGR